MEAKIKEHLFKDTMDSFITDMWLQYDNLLKLKQACKVAGAIPANFHYVYDSTKVNIFLSVDSFKDLMDVLELLQDQGYACTKTVDYPSYGKRKYLCGDITLSAYLTGKEKSCHVVQVGVKHEEVPIYEFQCD